MISFGVIVFCLILYIAELYVAAFWVIVFVIANGLLGAIRAVLNPDWYYNERMKAGLNSGMLNTEKQLKRMIITKFVIVLVLSSIAWHIGQKAGYF